MSYEDDLIRRIRQESSGVRSEAARRTHLFKMAIAGGVCALCLGLFAFRVLDGEDRKAQFKQLEQARNAGRPVEPRKTVEALAVASGPELAAVTVGAVSGLWFLFLLMRLRRFD